MRRLFMSQKRQNTNKAQMWLKTWETLNRNFKDKLLSQICNIQISIEKFEKFAGT